MVSENLIVMIGGITAHKNHTIAGAIGVVVNSLTSYPCDSASFLRYGKHYSFAWEPVKVFEPDAPQMCKTVMAD